MTDYFNEEAYILKLTEMSASELSMEKHNVNITIQSLKMDTDMDNISGLYLSYLNRYKAIEHFEEMQRLMEDD